MNISRFFIDRPIFAAVLSVLILLAGLLAVFRLPISEYPAVVPPSVVVRAQFPGANPKVIAETVAAPLEEAINGVENMLYMQSQANSDGNLVVTVNFHLGMDPDKAQQLVQNRVAQALPRLPEDVQRLGVTTTKATPTLTMVVHLVSPDQRYDLTYLRNYAVLNVKDRLARIPGVGEVQLWGAGNYSMRVWLNPEKIAERGLTASDIVAAIREQNVQVAAGVIGAAPSGPGVAMQFSVNAQGRLRTEEEFGDIVLKSSADGGIIRLRDVARIELAASDYALRSLLDNKPAVAMAIMEAPGANALAISDAVRQTMKALSADFPASLESRIVYDPTQFVRSSIKAVVSTLLEAIALVVLVVIVFLQTWRASIIPLLAVPVSIIGTFSLMLTFGYTINALSLFGLVLAIGIVVDDAIVVVENVERNIETGLSPRDATYRAMREVSGPIIAIALTLVAVFVPLAFMTGLSGQFFKQFAMTIAISTVISAFNSLTLSPALAALLLKPHDARPDALTRGMDRVLGGFFRVFNHMFGRASDGYARGVGAVVRRKGATLGVYLILLALTAGIAYLVPGGFVPGQDKQYLVSFAQLPSGASLERTDAVVRRMSEIALAQPGVKSVVAFPGLSINGFTNSSSAAVVFMTLDDFDKRRDGATSAQAITAALSRQFASIQEAFTAVFPPPPVMGLGTVGGFKLQIEDTAGLGYDRLNDAVQAFLDKAAHAPELGPAFSSYQINVPQLDVDLDRVKAKQLGVPVTNVFDTMQIYLGSLYINDFNRFGRVYQVKAQADAPFRSSPEDILRLKTRGDSGAMVPLGSLVSLTPTYGPEMVVRYNGYTAADINSGPAPGYSSGEAQAAAERIAADTLPKGIKFEWTDLTYQQILAGNAGIWVFPISVLLVFLVLAALYESLTLPLAVILIVPMSALAALAGVWLTRGDNNIFTQIGLMVLVGLACKNAILIVEFALELEAQGMSAAQAAREASRLRLRPILMTSIAFIMGIVPLVLSTGAGAEMRHAMGIAVFFGMLGVTAFGLYLTPVFYVLLRRLSGRSSPARHAEPATPGALVPATKPTVEIRS
ncbi:efflux RND transporter permease subunit [Castellaniella denitrificans]|uniref:Efflux pump membrane transporter n=1 Tax=Castellaniella denitrificans TaxID=56119 RepID=A0ABT4M6A3_9BURK|nr:multidrug efflux RND transporter permease subunit [Castellaniella denitrificans]MCZ4330847.1 multidrug efflux RND transporter permease subunit [Castellaniella denitrificans]